VAFLPLLKLAATGELPILKGHVGELSLNKIAHFLWPAREAGFEEKYEDRAHDRLRHGVRRYYRIARKSATGWPTIRAAP